MNLTIIQNKIYEIRGQRVMLDRDLAELYQVETRALNQVVKRNIQRFPSDFMFQLTEDEAKNLISHFVTSRWGGIRKLPYAFTEHGVATLSGLLNSNIAIETNIAIMRAFVAMRRYLSSITAPENDITRINKDIRELKQYIEEVFSDYNDINEDTAIQLELINQTLAELASKQGEAEIRAERKKIGYK